MPNTSTNSVQIGGKTAGNHAQIDSALTVESATELLRLVLPLMTKHKVPPTPRNYAIWFAYVRGNDKALKDAVDAMLKQNTAFDHGLLDQLYHQYIAHDELEEIEKVREAISGILREVQWSVDAASDNVGDYSGQLHDIADQVSNSRGLEDIENLIKTLITKTQAMEASSMELRANFEKKSAEIAELQQELERERVRAITDPLTGLANRQALMDAMEAAISAEDTGHPTALILLDIDHFKQVNDKFGHLIGDRVLRFVANLVRNQIKGKDTAARYGGEEFALLLPDTSIDGALAVAENVRRTIADSKLVRSETKQPLGKVTVSLGVAVYRSGEKLTDLIARADQALYAAKAAGRDQVKKEASNSD